MSLPLRSLVATTVAAAVLAVSACASTGAAPSGTQNAVPRAAANAIDAASAPFVASTKSRKFYPASCATAKLIKASDRLGFASIKDAESAGFAKDLYSTDCQY